MNKVNRPPLPYPALSRLWAGSPRYFGVLLTLPLAFSLFNLFPNRSEQAKALPQQATQASSLRSSWLPTLAQTSPSLFLSQQGNQVILNGQPFAIAWSQRQQQRFGIADAGLSQLLGVDLLSSADHTRQPVQWYSDPAAEPLILNAWLTGQYRYLDITDLANRAGWQVQAIGNSLRINTLPARVMSVRQGRQPWGDRIVVDLDRSASYQVLEQAGELVVTLNAQVDPTLLQNFVAGPGNRLTSLKVETTGTQTVIRAGIPTNLRPRLWTLPRPNRLIIDIRPDAMQEKSIAWAPGIRWQQQVVGVGSSRFPITFLTINPRQPGLTIKPIVSNPTAAPGTAPLVTTAQQQQAIAAINGGFFNRNNQLPLGALRQNGQWRSGPILNRGAIAWNDGSDFSVSRLNLQETLVTATGQRIPVLLLNSGYVQAGVALYTAEWGTTYIPLINDELIVTVQNDQVISQQQGGVAGQRQIPIPANGYLLAVRANGSLSGALAVGSRVQRSAATVPAEFDRYAQIMGAGPLLIQNRQIVLNPQLEQFSPAFIQQAASRSAIGVMADGNVILVAAHNRLNGTGTGPTLTEIAQVMQRLGAVNALNLDGGSSTSLYLGGQLIDRSPRTAARVHNGIGIFFQPGI